MTTEEFHRKLTAILSADVQGYSRLMGEDEEATVRTLTAYRALMSSLIQKHHGKIVDTPGDNLLAEFGSVMDAVRSAVEIQEELRIRNADLPENRRMEFRIGINMGDIIEDGDHIYGDGVNIAARVEGMAEGGGICISGTVYDAIRNKLSMSYEFMGEHVVKNIKELVRIYRIKVEPEAEKAIKRDKKVGLRRWQWAVLSVVVIILLGAVAYIVFDRFYLVDSDVQKAAKTIAVLPFDNLSSDPEQVYFVDGLSEEILNSLAQIPELTVIAKTSSFSFKGTNKTIQEIASVLGVENILEGSVRKAGNALRITAQLVKADDGSHLWSKTYDRELKDIFAVQEDIATAVAGELKATLGLNKSFKQLGGTDNVEAYELYLVAKGQMHNVADTPVMDRALESIDAALALDPKFALAWSVKAYTHSILTIFGPGNRAASEKDAALKAAQRAIELEPQLGDGYYQLGWAMTNKGEWIQAESAYRKAFELPTETSDYEIYLAIHYNAVGYFKKAHALLEDLYKNDPLNSLTRAHYTLSFAFLGDTQRAEEEYERGKALFGGQWTLGDIYITDIRLGFFDVVPSDIVYSNPIFNSAKEHLESPEEGLAELRRIYTNGDNLSSEDLGEIGRWAAYFGDPNFALYTWKKCLDIQTSGAFYFWLPVFKEVRQLPRFKEYVREIGLVDYWNKFGWPDICHKLDNGDFECD